VRERGWSLRSALRLIGPWPVRPAPITAFLVIFMILWAGARLSTEENPFVRTSFSMVLLGIASALIMGLTLIFTKKVAPHGISRAPGYFLALAVCAGIGATFRVTTNQLPIDPFPSPYLALLYSWLRLMLFLVVAQAIIGLVTRRVEDQVIATNAALESSHRLQQRLVETDERTRAQVATLLHDRVQAGLIAACLELTDAINDKGIDPAPTVRSVVDRLEAMRDLDVRQATRILSPDLTSLDLRTALEDLSSQYLPAMITEVEISHETTAALDRTHVQALLAAYRVTEQSLLNAAIHGRARLCRIVVDLSDDKLTTTISDDGSGLSESVRPGLGTFVIDTWVAICGGTWERRALPERGCEVTAVLPIAAAHGPIIAAEMHGTST
jgi:signal transduction histidine kinase